MIKVLEVVILIVVLALAYDFVNGLNDAANAIATIVATRLLSPLWAVALAATGNFVGPFLVGVAVATTIGKGIVLPEVIDFSVLIIALVAAIIWSYGATFKGIPISITHALVGGLVGAGIAKGGIGAIMGMKFMLIVLFIFIAPFIAFIIGIVFAVSITKIFSHTKPASTTSWFKRLQLLSSAFMSITHGSNDAQNAMGIIAITLFTAGYLGADFYVPVWVILICAGTISLGTLAGGWGVIKTMGMRVTRLRPRDGFCAETSGGLTILFCTMIGIPISTSHAVSSSIMGTGVVKRFRAVRWGVARNILWAWILTLPVTAATAFVFYMVSFPIL